MEIVIKIHHLFLTHNFFLNWFTHNLTSTSYLSSLIKWLGTVNWHDVKPFVDSDDGYMYSRTCKVKSPCQFTNYGQRKYLGNVIWSGCIWLHYRPIPQIPPCTCSIFHAPPCNRNIRIYANSCKNIWHMNHGIWNIGLLSTVVSK